MSPSATPAGTNNAKAVTVGCVPEHFSGPLYLLTEQQANSQDSSLDATVSPNAVNPRTTDTTTTQHPLVTILNMPGGTGQMIKALQNENLDVAVALTEGIVLNSCTSLLSNASNPIKLMGLYVDSSLCWSIAVSPNPSTPLNNISDLKGARIGVSRLGSGSHIMAVVLSMQQGWLNTEDDFTYVIANDIRGLIDGITNNTFDAFLWEITTTKPYYDTNTLKMLSTITPPWPSFVFAKRANDKDPKFNSLLSSTQQSVKDFCENFNTTGLSLFENRSDVFHYPNQSDILKWFEKVQFAKHSNIVSKSMLSNCVKTLVKANLIDQNELDLWENKHGSILEAICDPIVSLQD
ncbi:hypothetical protein HDV02_001815 [Globomyces sp. JEL0801]|nr:hypothetical protein HDV02_001798 [Globomyces sp. JEL0801]KAJ2999792.1 hypothetical protein HDV02_001815 [Globomyces sp. JEL0801]